MSHIPVSNCWLKLTIVQNQVNRWLNALTMACKMLVFFHFTNNKHVSNELNIFMNEIKIIFGISFNPLFNQLCRLKKKKEIYWTSVVLNLIPEDLSLMELGVFSDTCGNMLIELNTICTNTQNKNSYVW